MLFDANRKKSLEMSAMSQKCQKCHTQLCEESLQWKWKRENSHDSNRQYIEVVWREEKNGEQFEYKPRINVLRQMKIKWGHSHRATEDKTPLIICQMKGCWQRMAQRRTAPQIVGCRCLVLQYTFYSLKHVGAQKIRK